MEKRNSDSSFFVVVHGILRDVLVLPLLMVILSSGCATRVIPPARPVDAVKVYLTDYGKHSSIVLPAPAGGYEEYAFGDWDYFALGNTALPVALRALAGSPQSTIGRRHVPEPSDGGTLQSILGANRLEEFDASQSLVEMLGNELDARFRHDGDSAFHSDYSGLDHVRDQEHYWAGNNCNHVTAAWLRQLGCEIRGPAIFSNFLVAPPSHD